jgi:hypothetical protein
MHATIRCRTFCPLACCQKMWRYRVSEVRLSVRLEGSVFFITLKSDPQPNQWVSEVRLSVRLEGSVFITPKSDPQPNQWVSEVFSASKECVHVSLQFSMACSLIAYRDDFIFIFTWVDRGADIGCHTAVRRVKQPTRLLRYSAVSRAIRVPSASRGYR